MNNRMIPLTDDRGRLLVPSDEAFEPEAGSIVLVEGVHGTAWQRLSSDGLWHSARSNRAFDWEAMLTNRSMILVYDAEPRPWVPKTRPASESGIVGVRA